MKKNIFTILLLSMCILHCYPIFAYASVNSTNIRMECEGIYIGHGSPQRMPIYGECPLKVDYNDDRKEIMIQNDEEAACYFSYEIRSECNGLIKCGHALLNKGLFVIDLSDMKKGNYSIRIMFTKNIFRGLFDIS